MRRARSSAGYAMLAALLIMVLAATFALAVVAAVQGLHTVERADAGGRRAAVLEGRALEAAAHTLRWDPAAATGSAAGHDAAGDSWQVGWAPAPPVAGDEWSRLRVAVATRAGRSQVARELTLELRAEPWAAGVTCVDDAEVSAELAVSGSGVYVGGCLRGRENVRFVPDVGPPAPGGRPADRVRSALFPAAAVHGGVGIYARGAEIHAAGASAEFPDDSDRHEGSPVEPEWLRAPGAEFLAAAALGAVPAAPWVRDGRLRLDEIPPAPPGAAAGRCLLLAGADEFVIEGAAPPVAGRLLLVVDGDAVVGQPGAPAELAGGLVVLGRLTVRGGLDLAGSLHARSLTVAAPTRVVISVNWRRLQLPGATVPVVVERGD